MEEWVWEGGRVDDFDCTCGRYESVRLRKDERQEPSKYLLPSRQMTDWL